MLEWILSSCVLIIAIALLSLGFKGKIPSRLQYALWGLVLLRLLVPVSFFHGPVSTENLVVFIEKQPAVQSVVSSLNTPAISADQALQQAKEELAQAGIREEAPEASLEQRQQTIMEQSSPAFTLETIAYALWFAGIAVTALCFLLSNIRFARHLKKHRMILEGTGSVRRVYICEGLDTPCLFGLIHPAIYLTPGEAADEVRLRHIIAHETTHLRHLDHIWSTLRCVCLVLHWYNPLVWLAASLSRRDAELACDEATIRRIGEDQRISYGTTLIEMTCARSSATGLLDIATTMTGSKTAIKERVMMIAKKRKTVLYALIAALLITAITAGCAFTGAAPSTSVPAETAAPTETTAPTEPTPAETTPTTQPKPVETVPSATEPTYETLPDDWRRPRPDIPEKYDIRIAYTDWEQFSPLPEDASDYYPIWGVPITMITWLDARMDELAKDEDPSVLAWAEYEMKLQAENIYRSSARWGVVPTEMTQADWDAQRLPIPEKYDIRIAYPDWDETQPLPEDASEYYPIWEDEIGRIPWLYEVQLAWAGIRSLEDLSPEDQAVLLWTECEIKHSAWQIYKTYEHAGRITAESPYVVPDRYNIHVIYPDWDPSQGDPPDTSYGSPFTWVAYPEHWTVGERVIWLKSKYDIRFGDYLVHQNNPKYFTEEYLTFVAWLEAELEFLDSPPLVSIFEELELNKEDYLVRK